MQGGCQGYLAGGDGSTSRVGGLEDSGVQNDLAVASRSRRPESNQEFLIPGQVASYPCDGRSDPLIAGNHVLDGPLFRREDLVEC